MYHAFFFPLDAKLVHMEIQNNSSNSGTDENGKNSDHSDRGASNGRVLPFSIETILSAPHPLPLSSLKNFICSNLPQDISATENAERGMMKI